MKNNHFLGIELSPSNEYLDFAKCVFLQHWSQSGPWQGTCPPGLVVLRTKPQFQEAHLLEWQWAAIQVICSVTTLWQSCFCVCVPSAAPLLHPKVDAPFHFISFHFISHHTDASFLSSETLPHSTQVFYLRDLGVILDISLSHYL